MLVIGFSALRGAPTTEPTGVRTLPRLAPQPPDVAPLVLGDVDPRMAEFKQWILNILSRAAQGRAKELAIKTLLEEIIADLVPGDFVGFAELDEADVISLRRRGDSESKVPFAGVSQGMSSIFNWVGVLVQRLYDVYGESTETPHHGHAVVLVDEIDVHLHPDWQRRLVELTKRFFPNVQILATTHSPLIASSLCRDELRILQPGGRIEKPSMETYGRSADEIMQSEVGGLRNARPFEVEEKINEYKRLFAKASRTEKEQMRLEHLQTELREIGWLDLDDDADEWRPPTPEALSAFMAKYRQ